MGLFGLGIAIGGMIFYQIGKSVGREDEASRYKSPDEVKVEQVARIS
jgi:hypothetical protein